MPTDKERLDWLQRAAWGVAYNFDRKKAGKYKCHVGEDPGTFISCDGYGETPRQAIDAAMMAEKKARRSKQRK